MIFQLVPSSTGGEWTETRSGASAAAPMAVSPAGSSPSRLGHFWGVAGAGGSGACTGGCGYLFRLESTRGAAPGPRPTSSIFLGRLQVRHQCGGRRRKPLWRVFDRRSSQRVYLQIKKPRTPADLWTTLDLYDFAGVPRGSKIGDGANPLGVTFDAHGNLWGATVYGGYCQRFEGGSCFGAIFELMPPAAPSGEWSETVAYRFRNRDENPTLALRSTAKARFME